MELNIERFSPTKAELAKMAAEAEAITADSPADEVKDTRIVLKKARTTIAKIGKDLREDAVAFQKAVITKEKELIAIIEPQEERLAEIEDSQHQQREREERREFLPRRKERLAAIGDDIEVLDEELLNMDGSAFEGYINKRAADKIASERRKLEEDQRQIEAEKAEIAHKKELQEAEERGRREAQEKAHREQLERQEREASEKKEAEERAAREKSEAEERERQEQAKRNSDARYQAFLKEHDYNSESFTITKHIDGVITLWKKVATFDSRDNHA